MNVRSPNYQQVMPTQLPPPDEEAFVREIHDLFSNGDLTHIARYLRHDQSRISRSYNPYCSDVKCVEYELLCRLWAMDCERPGLADAVLMKITGEREKWTTDGVSVAESHAKLTRKVGDELMEAVEAEMGALSLDTQIEEWGDVVREAQAKKNALIAERARGFSPRQYAKTAVNGNGAKR